MIKAIIFDFDGVIVESVDIKTEAFKKLFSFAPLHLSKILQYHQQNSGVSRFDKFRYIHKHILHEPLSPERFSELSERFSSLVIGAVVAAHSVNGAEEFLEKWYRKLPLFIVSATPEKELREIVRMRGISRYFRGIYGSPCRKEEHIRALIREYKADPGEVVYVGDATNDLNAARNAGIRFIGRIRPGIKNPFTGEQSLEHTIRDLNELAEYMEERGW
jgi:HAD superfamily hydrolase (TIGR01549 family)